MQLKRWLRPMRGIKTMTGLQVLAAGHAFVQNLRPATTRSPPINPETVDSRSHSANWPRHSEVLHRTRTTGLRHARPILCGACCPWSVEAAMARRRLCQGTTRCAAGATKCW